MSDLIDRQAAIEALRRAEALTFAFGYHNVIGTIHELPTVDVPDRKVGKWIVIMDEPTITFDECKCSECGVVEYFNKGWKKFNYCPNCGARMKGERSEDGATYGTD